MSQISDGVIDMLLRVVQKHKLNDVSSAEFKNVAYQVLVTFQCPRRTVTRRCGLRMRL